MNIENILSKFEKIVIEGKMRVDDFNDIMELNIDQKLANEINQYVGIDIYSFRDDENVDLSNRFKNMAICAISVYLLSIADDNNFTRLFINDKRDFVTVRINKQEESEILISELSIKDLAISFSEEDELRVGISSIFEFINQEVGVLSVYGLLNLVNWYNKEFTILNLRHRESDGEIVYSGKRTFKIVELENGIITIDTEKLFFNKSNEKYEIEDD